MGERMSHSEAGILGGEKSKKLTSKKWEERIKKYNRIKWYWTSLGANDWSPVKKVLVSVFPERS